MNAHAMAVLIPLLLSPLLSEAQNQGNIWYFGINVGLNFNSLTVSVLNDGMTDGGFSCGDVTTEGTTTVSDSLGNLLFYSDGTRVWGNGHGIVTNGNGLHGGVSSTHACLAVPQPQSSTLYYLFTLDDFCNNFQNGLRYSMVDVCGREGIEVLEEQKNVLLLDTASEKMALIRHANGTDYWLVVHRYFSNSFYCYHISPDGIGNPIVSSVGTVHEPLIESSEPYTAIGQMKASPTGEVLAVAAGNGAGLLELFHFDANSGHLSLLYNLSAALPFTSGYGVSFSPDGKILYASFLHLYQFDLSSGIEDVIKNSITQLSPSGGNISYRGLQLGPDGKVYVSRNSNRLSVISSPNETGLACDYQHDVIDLGSGFCEYSLPSFIDSYDYTASGFCNPNGLEEAEQSRSLHVHPNPAMHTVRLEVSGSTFNVQSLTITDMLGNTVMNLKPETLNLELDISGLANGIYTVAVQGRDGEVLRARLVVGR